MAFESELTLSLLAAFLLVLAFQYCRPSRSSSWPPGPKGWPLVGNIPDLSGPEPFKRFAEWRKDYGMYYHWNTSLGSNSKHTCFR